MPIENTFGHTFVFCFLQLPQSIFSPLKFGKGRTHQLVIQYQMVHYEFVHTSNVVQMDSVVFRNIYAYISTNKHTTIINDQRRHEFERE